jgi:hypothetical protein
MKFRLMFADRAIAFIPEYQIRFPRFVSASYLAHEAVNFKGAFPTLERVGTFALTSTQAPFASTPKSLA